jgi:hypothetical protein
LVKGGKAVKLPLGSPCIQAFTQHSDVKSCACHGHQLINEDIARSANFTLETQAASKQKSLTVSAAIGEFGKVQVDALNSV